MRNYKDTRLDGRWFMKEEWKSSQLHCSLVFLDIYYKLPNSLVDPGVRVVKMLVLEVRVEKYIGENKQIMESKDKHPCVN